MKVWYFAFCSYFRPDYVFSFVECDSHNFEYNSFSQLKSDIVEIDDCVKHMKEIKGNAKEEVYLNYENDNIFYKQSYGYYEEELVEKDYVGSLSEDLANIGHIDSSETSDDSPEGNINL